MSYQCRDCSYRASSPFANGRCPACGSYNVLREQPIADTKARQHSALRLALLLLLWGYLLWEIGRRLME